MGKDQLQICMIKIVFPAESDEQAIAYHKKIKEMLSEIPDSQIDFRLMSGRPAPPA